MQIVSTVIVLQNIQNALATVAPPATVYTVIFTVCIFQFAVFILSKGLIYCSGISICSWYIIYHRINRQFMDTKQWSRNAIFQIKSYLQYIISNRVNDHLKMNYTRLIYLKNKRTNRRRCCCSNEIHQSFLQWTRCGLLTAPWSSTAFILPPSSFSSSSIGCCGFHGSWGRGGWEIFRQSLGF